MRKLNDKEINSVSGGAYLDKNGNLVTSALAGTRPTNADGYVILGPNVPVIVGSTKQ